MLAKTVTNLMTAVAIVGSATAFAQTGGSAIVGTVRDETRGSLPGVGVTAESPALIGRAKSTVTGPSGEYQIVDLRPGSYTITFTLPGFKTVRREGIDLSTSFTASVNVTMAVGALEETLTIVGESPLVDVRSAASETALRQELLEGIPVGRNIFQVGQMVPGATTTRPDVGGSETAQITNISIHGSSGQDITFNMDGQDVTGSNGNGGTIATYYNEGFNQEIVVQTKAGSAEMPAGGLNINMVKKQGSNQFKGALHFSFSGHSLQSDNVSDEQRRLGLVSPSAMDRAYDLNPGFGGPILRDKLWFYASYRRWRVDRIPANTFNTDGSPALDEQLLWNGGLSLTYQINKSNRLSGSVDYLDKIRAHRRDRTSTYQFISPEAAYVQPNNGPTGSVKWTSTISDNAMLEGGFSWLWLWWGLTYQPEIAPDALPRNDIERSTLTGAAPNALLRENILRRTGTFVFSWLPSWKGSHNIRIGGKYADGPLSDSRSTLGHGDLVARYRDGVPNSVQVFNTPIESQVTMFDHGLFAQDAWTIKKRLTVSAGVRADFFRGRVDEQRTPAGTFVPERHFPQMDNVPNWKTVVPRLAFVYDLFGNGKTALKWNASKYMQKQATGIINNVNPLRLNSEIRSWTDANGDRIPQLSEIGPSLGGLGRGATVRLDPDLRRPSQWEFTVGLDHQLSNTLAVAATYYRRSYYDLFTTINVALQPSDYTPVTITNPLTAQPLTVFNQNLATRGRVDNLLTNSDALSSSYNGFEVTLNKRMANNFMLFGGFTLAAHKQCGSGAASTNPNDHINACGYDDFDSKYMLNVSGVYRLPAGFNVSGHLVHSTGKPLGRAFIVTRAIVPNLTQVNQTVALLPRGELRRPAWTLLDLRLSREFRLGRGTSFELLLDVFNLLNENSALQEVETIGTALGRISQNIDGRLVRLGAKFSF